MTGLQTRQRVAAGLQAIEAGMSGRRTSQRGWLASRHRMLGAYPEGGSSDDESSSWATTWPPFHLALNLELSNDIRPSAPWKGGPRLCGSAHVLVTKKAEHEDIVIAMTNAE